MGLDNGIWIKRSTAPQCASKIFHEEEWEKKYDNIEVAYWRKCWNVRDIILDLLDAPIDNDTQTPMSVEDVVAIINVLKKLKAKNYTDRGSCIWEWKDFRNINRRNIAALRRLVRLMKKNDNIKVYFYDSW